MHEMALVRNVVDIVLEHAEKAGATEVKAVHLTIGYGRDVVEEYMDGLFQFLARGTVAEHAELVISRVPYTVRCNKCGFVFPLNVFDQSTWVCPACKTERDYTLNTGREFFISRIEVTNEPRPAGAGEDAASADADAPTAETASA